MFIKSLPDKEWRIVLEDYEVKQLHILVINSEQFSINDITSLLHFHLKFLVDNAFLTIKEPPDPSTQKLVEGDHFGD